MSDDNKSGSKPGPKGIRASVRPSLQIVRRDGDKTPPPRSDSGKRADEAVFSQSKKASTIPGMPGHEKEMSTPHIVAPIPRIALDTGPDITSDLVVSFWDAYDVTIGAGSDCMVVFPGAGVDDHHAAIMKEGGIYVLTVLTDNADGVTVRNKKLKKGESIVVTHGELIVMGRTQVKLLIKDPTAPQSDPESASVVRDSKPAADSAPSRMTEPPIQDNELEEIESSASFESGFPVSILLDDKVPSLVVSNREESDCVVIPGVKHRHAALSVDGGIFYLSPRMGLLKVRDEYASDMNAKIRVTDGDTVWFENIELLAKIEGKKIIFSLPTKSPEIVSNPPPSTPAKDEEPPSTFTPNPLDPANPYQPTLAADSSDGIDSQATPQKLRQPLVYSSPSQETPPASTNAPAEMDPEKLNALNAFSTASLGNGKGPKPMTEQPRPQPQPPQTQTRRETPTAPSRFRKEMAKLLGFFTGIWARIIAFCKALKDKVFSQQLSKETQNEQSQATIANDIADGNYGPPPADQGAHANRDARRNAVTVDGDRGPNPTPDSTTAPTTVTRPSRKLVWAIAAVVACIVGPLCYFWFKTPRSEPPQPAAAPTPKGTNQALAVAAPQPTCVNASEQQVTKLFAQNWKSFKTSTLVGGNTRYMLVCDDQSCMDDWVSDGTWDLSKHKWRFCPEPPKN